MPESTVETYVTDAPDKVVSVPSVTASLYVCAPVVMTEPPLNCVVPLASVVTDPKPASWDKLSRASLPMAPPKTVAPACVLTVKENWLPPALSTVEANVTLPGPLSSITTSAVSSTGSLNVAEAPFRWMSAAISVVPSALVVSVPKRPVPPTTPPNTVAPPPLVLTVSEAQARP